MSNLLQSVSCQHWFVVFSKPRQEAEAIRQLERQGFTIVFPDDSRTTLNARILFFNLKLKT